MWTMVPTLRAPFLLLLALLLSYFRPCRRRYSSRRDEDFIAVSVLAFSPGSSQRVRIIRVKDDPIARSPFGIDLRHPHLVLLWQSCHMSPPQLSYWFFFFSFLLSLSAFFLAATPEAFSHYSIIVFLSIEPPAEYSLCSRDSDPCTGKRWTLD